jgi:hypothetical protein
MVEEVAEVGGLLFKGAKRVALLRRAELLGGFELKLTYFIFLNSN